MANERPDPVWAEGHPPSDDVMARWRSDWRTIPREQWDIARRTGWIGPQAGWVRPFGPKPAPDKDDVARQNVIEYEFEKLGFEAKNRTWILDRPASSSTFVAFRLGRDGTLLPGHPMPWDQRGALCIVRLGEVEQGSPKQQFSCSIQVWNIWNERLTDHGWSVLGFDDEAAADIGDEAYFRAKYDWYMTDAAAENSYQAVRRATHDIFGESPDGLVYVGPFDVGRQPEQPEQSAPIDQPPAPAPPTREPVDAFQKTVERAAELDALYELDPSPSEHWIDESDELGDATPLAPTPDRVFELPVGDMEGGSVILHGHQLVLITTKGHIRSVAVPAEFMDESEVNVDGVMDWLAVTHGDRPDDIPTDLLDGTFLGFVTDDAVRTPIDEVADDAKRRRRRRNKFLLAGAAATTALGVGANSCGLFVSDAELDQSRIDYQDELVLEEMAEEQAEEQAAIDCLVGGPLWNADTGSCDSGGEAFDDAASWCSDNGGEWFSTEVVCSFSAVDTVGLCGDNGGDLSAEGTACEFATTDVIADDDQAAGTCSAGLTWDAIEQACTSMEADSAAGEACENDGGEWRPDDNVCFFTPEGHHAAFGMAPPGPATDDPPGGQSGSDENEWTATVQSDVATFSAWITSILDDVFAQVLGNTSFPCGANTDEYRVFCPLGAPAAEPGDWVVISATLAASIEPDGNWLTYGVAFDDPAADNYSGRPPYGLDLFNDTEAWYRYEIDPEGVRHVYADGFREGAPNFPRPSSLRLVEFDDTLLWAIPRAELPEGELRYRLTAFRSETGPLAPPDPKTSGGDVSGLDVSTLDVVPDQVVVAILGPDIPPDAEPQQELSAGPGDDPDLFMATVLIDDLATRWNTAFEEGSVDAVISIIHPGSVFNSADSCRAFVERIFPGAQEVVLTPDGLGPTVNGISVGYGATAQVTYPTGTTEFVTQLAIGPGGRLAPVFDCAT